MKRRYLLLTCLLAAAVLTGCAGEDPQNAVRSGVVSMPRTDVEGFLKGPLTHQISKGSTKRRSALM